MLPLSEITVVITRPREQAFELSREFEQLGAKVFLFPTIEIVPPESYTDLDAAIANLSNYDWLIFTSANGAEHFLRRLEAQNIETSELDYLQVCAIGEATAERLRLAQIHLDLIPTDSSAEGVFSALENYLGGAREFPNVRFLLPRSKIARDFLPRKLREAGAIVDNPTAYQTVQPDAPETGKLKALLQGGAIDCVTFTSPSTVKNFIRIFAAENLLQLLGGIKIACLGEVTANAVGKFALQVDVVSSEANSASFARSVADYFSAR
jgi:uroporphyrinogen III methyltransferase/synthase